MIQACSARHVASVAPLTKDRSLFVASQMEAFPSRFIANLNDDTHKQKCGLITAAHMHIYNKLAAATCVKKRCTFMQMYHAQVQPIGIKGNVVPCYAQQGPRALAIPLQQQHGMKACCSKQYKMHLTCQPGWQ